MQRLSREEFLAMTDNLRLAETAYSQLETTILAITTADRIRLVADLNSTQCSNWPNWVKDALLSGPAADFWAHHISAKTG